jgi:hypothetical protein
VAPSNKRVQILQGFLTTLVTSTQLDSCECLKTITGT